MNKNYYAIIPATVRYNKKLSANDKLLYAELSALTNERGFCWATNKYLANLFDVDARTIQRRLKTLADEKFIEIHIKRNPQNNAVISRIITLIDCPPPRDKTVMTPRDNSVMTPRDKTVAYNNINNNNINNINNKSSSYKHEPQIHSRNYTSEEIAAAFAAIETFDEF